jgi:aminopeptidase N
LFGNYVNLPYWDKLFLKEGFATLYQFVIPAKIYPDKYFKDGLRTKACVRAAAVDITTSISMTTYVETEAKIRAKFDAISYSKAGCFYGMIMNAISEETWLKAMHYYLTENALKTSDTDDVHAAIQKAINEDFGTSQIDIAPIMKSWENQPGFPIVKVEKQNDKIILSQERFWLNLVKFIRFQLILRQKLRQFLKTQKQCYGCIMRHLNLHMRDLKTIGLSSIFNKQAIIVQIMELTSGIQSS